MSVAEVIKRRAPFLLMALGGISLLAALWGGLSRLGWPIPFWGPLVSLHGPLMVSGFLGTLISLERVVAVGRPWAYAIPLLTGLGSAGLIAGLPPQAGALLFSLGSLGYLSLFGIFLKRQKSLALATIGIGAVCWTAGNLLWLAGRPVFQVVPWWAGFLVLTIAGERLELSRFKATSRTSRIVLLLIFLLFLTGLAVSATATLKHGLHLAGMAMILLSVWLFKEDIAWKNLKNPGLPRFTALCLLTGFFWLGVSGVLTIAFAGDEAGLGYDAFLHSLFLGFVFSMIFGHAPIILPAVLKIKLAFRRTSYIPLVLLHGTLLVRLLSVLTGWLPGRPWGGLLNAAVVLVFLLNMKLSVQRPARPL